MHWESIKKTHVSNHAEENRPVSEVCVCDKHMDLKDDRSKEALLQPVALLFMNVYAVQWEPGSV